jgi:hypothetical protein
MDNKYDGTIIDGTQLTGNTKYPISEQEGPSEIVIKQFELFHLIFQCLLLFS